MLLSELLPLLYKSLHKGFGVPCEGTEKMCYTTAAQLVGLAQPAFVCA